MSRRTQHAPVLVFTYGNPSRGDDALGPAMYDMLEHYKNSSTKLDHVDLLTDYQLQIEHVIDLEQRESVVFVDASVSATPPYELDKLKAVRDNSYTTHAMSPAALLALYEQINKHSSPASYLFSIRAYEFELGACMTAQAGINLQQAYTYLTELLENNIAKPSQLHVI